jgi:hypothetical protein
MPCPWSFCIVMFGSVIVKMVVVVIGRGFGCGDEDVD